MRLTKTIRDAFVRAAMADVPQRDYQAEIHKLLQDDAISKLPPKVKAIADDKDLRHFLKTESHYIKGYQCSNVKVMHPEYTRSPKVNEKVEALLVEFAEQTARNNALRTKLAATADAVTTRKALYDVAERAFRALDSEDFPQLKADLKEAIDQEQEAATKYQYSLKINMGGNDDAIAYFNVESGDTPNEWVVAEGAKCFYKGIEITDLFEGSSIDEQIYVQSNEVEDMMADEWAEHMIDKYADIND